MYCPNCATQTSVDQKFCRNCGMNLTLVSQAMTSHQVLPGSSDASSGAESSDDSEEDRKSNLMRRGFVLLFAGLVFCILMGIGGGEVQRLNIPLGHLMNSLAGLGAAGLLAGVGMIVYAALLPSHKLRHQARPIAIPPPAATIRNPGATRDTASMEPDARQAPSVTEHTTYTLDPQKPGTA